MLSGSLLQSRAPHDASFPHRGWPLLSRYWPSPEAGLRLNFFSGRASVLPDVVLKQASNTVPQNFTISSQFRRIWGYLALARRLYLQNQLLSSLFLKRQFRICKSILSHVKEESHSISTRSKKWFGIAPISWPVRTCPSISWLKVYRAYPSPSSQLIFTKCSKILGIHVLAFDNDIVCNGFRLQKLLSRSFKITSVGTLSAQTSKRLTVVVLSKGVYILNMAAVAF